jgi:hypothetical protein
MADLVVRKLQKHPVYQLARRQVSAMYEFVALGLVLLYHW